MDKEILANASSEMTNSVEEPIACVMEAILMPAGAYKAGAAIGKGDAAAANGESLGRGVVYLYLHPGTGLQGLSGYANSASKKRPTIDPISFRLTTTETAVLERLSEGKSNKAIASDMFVSVNTIKTHVRSIFQKLNVNCRSAAVRKAIDNGISRCSD